MDCKFNMQDMIPFAALAKLSSTEDIAHMSDRDFLIKISEKVWDYENLYHDISEHEGFKWGDKF
ncbi:MAG: hypothetical protein MR324_03765 [Lachnospiraceae bacterium]|nr:hypothetical protein [Lachnospiraceae bacterium]